jgi:hypothetical protein
MLTNLNWLEDGQPWPPVEEASRIAGMTANIDIFSGGRDSFLVMKNWMEKDREAVKKKLHIKVPLPEKAVSVVLNGALPECNIVLEAKADNDALTDWMGEDRFSTTLEELGADWCRCGVAVAKVSRGSEKVRVRSVRPDCWIPVCYPDDDRTFQYHVIATTWTEGVKIAGRSQETWLKIEIHSEKWIEYRLYQVNNAVAGASLTRKALDEKPELFEGYDLGADDRQVIPGWCVFPIWNSRTSDKAYGVPDASFSPEALSIVEGIEMALSQRRFNHSSHSKPVTAVGRAAVARDPNTDRVEVDLEKVLVYDDIGPESAGGAIVSFTSPGLESSPQIVAEIQDLLIAFVNVTELSAAFVSGVESSNVSSGRALMLELTPTMDHLRRFRGAFWGAIPAILESASRLSLGDVPQITAKDVTFNWDLSLASDPMETAQRHEILVRSQIYSPQQCHREMGLSQEESDAIMKELAAARSAQSVGTVEPLAIEPIVAEEEPEEEE